MIVDALESHLSASVPDGGVPSRSLLANQAANIVFSVYGNAWSEHGELTKRIADALEIAHRSASAGVEAMPAIASGTALINAERQRQLEEEGWTPEHDDKHIQGELALAAACYAWPPMRPLFVKKAWPWDFHYWKPEDFGIGEDKRKQQTARIRVLVKAGALIAAEIDRLQRAKSLTPARRRVETSSGFQ